MGVYEQARDLAEAGNMDGSWKIIDRVLRDNPNDGPALVTASFIMRRAGHLPESYHFAKASTQILPRDAASWINLGHVASELWLTKEAEDSYRKALKCPNIEFGTLKRSTLLNMSALYIDNGRYSEALPIARRILERNPGDKQAMANVGFCQLAMRDWTGWANYRGTLGSEWRPVINYKGEPEWQGEPGKTVVLYGEQGIGDEISFASMLPDMEKHCKKVILDCEPRLAGLFQRSFPNIKVHGTRLAKSGKWPEEDRDFDASLAMGQIGEYFRTTPESFPGKPYLTPCPTRTAMWKSTFKAKGKPCIGIAWRGGVPKTNARNRQLMLTDLLPLFESIDAHWVSLQYKDASKEIAEFKAHHDVDLEQYKFATLTHDYDDTAAMVAALDYVVCIQTAVAHTAGALGTPVAVLVPIASQWRYGTAHESIPWYDCLKVVRQNRHGSWRGEVDRAAALVAAHFGRVPQGAAEAPRDDEIRDCIFDVCPDGSLDHQPA